MKNILLLVHDDDGEEARLQAALDITRAFNGHLTCLDVSVMPLQIADPYGGLDASLLLGDEQTREAANRTRMEKRLAHEDVSWTWIDRTGTIAACIEDEAALAHLIVVNRQLDKFPVPDMRGVAGDLILKCGKPILAVPDDTLRFDFAGRALMCWDGSPAARAAMEAAVPLFQKAGSVELFEFEDGSVTIPAEEAAEYLSRHEIHAVVTRRKNAQRAAEAILSEARHGFAYVVMGGFGHARLIEAMFGGATRLMLMHSPIPLLLAHG